MEQKRAKNRVWKFLRIFFLSAILFIIALVIIAALAEDRIARLAFSKVRSSLEVPLEVNDISFTLLKKFPLATVEFNNVVLGYPADSTGSRQKDSLVNIGRIYISVESVPLIDGIFNVKDVEIEGADIDYIIYKNGKSNFDFLKDTTSSENDTVNSILDLTLKKFLLKNIRIHYQDSLYARKATVTIPALKLRGKVKNKEYGGAITGNAFISDVNIEGTPLHRMKQTEITFDMGFRNDSLKINSLTVVTDGAFMSAEGIALLKDSITADLKLTGKDLDLAILKKYIPKDTLDKYGITGISGVLDFNTSVSGEVSDSTMPYLEMNLDIKNAGVVTKDYPELSNINSKIFLTNGEQRNDKTSALEIKDLSFSSGNSKGRLSVKVKDISKPFFDLKANLDINLSNFKEFIPDTLVRSATGNVKAKFAVRGSIPDSVTDAFINKTLNTGWAEIEMANVTVLSDSLPEIRSLSGNLSYHPGNIVVSNLSLSIPEYELSINNSSFSSLLKGDITKPSETILDSVVFNLNSTNSSVQGSAFISNLTRPEFRFKGTGDIDLKDFKGLTPDSLVKDMSGLMRFSVDSKGMIDPDSLEEQIPELLLKNSNITVETNMVTLGMQDSLMSISDLTGEVTIDPDSLTCSRISGNYLGIDFSGDSIKVLNLFDTYFLNREEQLYAEGSYHLGDIDYTYLAPLIDTTETDNGTEEGSEVPRYTFLFKGKASVNSLKYNKVVFRDMSVLFKAADSVYILDRLKFEAFGGNADVSVKYKLMPGTKTVINTKFRINKIDVNRMLREFDDFKEYGNNEISAENISGIVTAQMNIKMEMQGDSILSNSTKIKGDFRIGNGGIYNYKPAMDMAEFTGLKELDNIRFKTFESKIFMFKNKLYVPRTYIISSALDIGFFGMQSLGEDYEYHIQLHLRDVLKGKSQKLLKRQAASGSDISDKDLDRSTVKLIYAYIDGKSKVGFDRKKAQRMMELKIKTQEKVLDLVFFPKLVSFDTGVK